MSTEMKNTKTSTLDSTKQEEQNTIQAYEVARNTKVRITDDEVKVPPGAKGLKKGDIVSIINLDGMYCNAIDEEGVRMYLAAWTKVEIVK